MPTAPLELRLLDALLDGDASPAQLATRLGVPESGLAPSSTWAERAGYVRRTDLPSGPSYALTPTGAQLATTRREMASARGADGRLDVGKVTELVVRQQYELVDVQFHEAARQQAGIPVSDAWRDWGTTALSEAFGAGRLTQEQLDSRAAAVLTAQTMGDLRTALGDVARLPLVPGVRLPARAETPLPVPRPPTQLGSGWLWVVVAMFAAFALPFLRSGDPLGVAAGVVWLILLAVLVGIILVGPGRDSGRSA
ncbi:MAG: DUF1707 domain-containing protein [Nocardioides sp.]